MRRVVSCGRHAHPDLYVKIEDQIAEDDRVATRWRATAVSGESRSYVGISIVRLLAGKQVDSHTEYTNLTHDEAGLDELAEVNAPFRSSLGST